MAGIIAWQDFEAAHRVAQERAAVLAGQALAKFQAAIVSITGSGLAASPRLSAAACPARGVSAEASAHFTVPLLLLDAAGHVQCRLRDAPAIPQGGLASFNAVHAGAPFALGMIAASGAASRRPIIAVPVGTADVAILMLPPTWLNAALAPETGDQGAATWLLDDHLGVVAAAGAAVDAQYTKATLKALLANNVVAVRGLSTTGGRFAYATSVVPGGWRLIAGVSAEPEHAHAMAVLFARAAELGALLVVGLVAVVLGADVAFGAPLRRLRDAVRRWQGGEPFSPGDLTGAPDEVLQLAHSFTAATAVLRDKQDELVRAQKQQTLLVLEVHHRVKNNLQVIASLLNLQASRIRLPEARAEFQAARDRVRALATLHRHLYADGSLHTINMRSFLTELCSQLFQALGETEGDRIQLQIDAPEMRLSSDDAVPLALIVTEAVSNSLKFAFPAGRCGFVCVSLTEADGTLELVISDNGVGIAASYPHDGGGGRDGIGLRLIRGFTRQLRASLAVQHDSGTRYVVRMPIKPPTPSRQEPLDAAVATGDSAV